MIVDFTAAAATMQTAEAAAVNGNPMVIGTTGLSEAQLAEDIGFLTDFTLAMADAVKCPVSREIPDSVKTKLDEYLLRKRRKDS